MKMYYQDRAVTLYHGDCQEWRGVTKSAVLLTDPPYGIRADEKQAARAGRQDGQAVAPSRSYSTSAWDREAAPISELLRHISACRYAIIWGGNFFALPASSCWLVWDKDNGDNGYADCELAWTNLPGAVRRFRHRWMGMLQEAGVEKEPRIHPTQKPEPVIRWAITRCPDDATVFFDPYAGSGTTLVEAKRLGRKAIGIELNEAYCEIAAKRLSQGALPLDFAI